MKLLKFAKVIPKSEIPDTFGPTASWERLELRARLLRRLRTFFEERDFLEVETPLLSDDTVIDRYLDPIPVTLFDDPTRPDVGPRKWLQTSPEYAMKRLLASGAERIFQVTRAFRGGEFGSLHNPEFTIVEWYRVGDGLEQGLQLLAELTQTLLESSPVRRMSYHDAFQLHAGIDPHTTEIEELKRAAEALGVGQLGGAGLDRDGWLNLLLADKVESHLGHESPVILVDYPASQAALARVRDSVPAVAERFELYVRGVELANGYHELVDPEELRQRNRRVNQARQADGKVALPEESRLLDAMTHGLPPCTGVALGFDRLAMVAAGADCIQDVMAFPIERA